MRDATDYYNLFPATLKNGNNQIIYLYNKRFDALEKGKYINVSTGCLITRNSPFYKSKDFYFYDDDEFPLCYKFSCRGLARLNVIRKILKFYADGLREYERTKDEEKMKELVDNEVENAKRNYEYLNKKNKGYDDLKLFNIPPHASEPQEEEDSVNSSSLKDNNNSYNDNNSFINDGEIEEEEEGEEEDEYIDNENEEEVEHNDNNNEEEDGDGDKNKNENDEDNKKEEENNKKRKGKLLIKNFNKYRKELDVLKEENRDEEFDLEEENENENSDIIKTSLKKKKLCKSRFLNRKIKRNIITDSDEENEENNENEDEKIVEKEEEKEEKEEKEKKNIEKKFDDKIEETSEIKNILKIKEEEVKYNGIFNNIKNNKAKVYKTNKMNKVPSKKSKLKQGNLNAFLKIIQ